MITIPVRPRTLRRRLALAAFGVLIAAGCLVSQAKADPAYTEAEQAYVAMWGPVAICPILTKYPSLGGLTGVIQGVEADGWEGYDAGQIVGAAIRTYCPRYIPLATAWANNQGGTA